MKERKIMSQDGIIIVTITLKDNELITNPCINTRGFVLVNDNAELLHELEENCKQYIINKLKNNSNIIEIKSGIISELSNLASIKTGRRPLILPVIMEIKNK